MVESTFSWRAHPAADRPLAASASLIVIFGMGYLAGVIAGENSGPTVALIVALASVAVLVLSLHRFFFATTFVMTSDSIVARGAFGRRSLEWTRVRRFDHDQRGGFLSTRARRSRFEAFRGMNVVFGPNPTVTIQAIRARVGEAHRASSATTMVPSAGAHGTEVETAVT